MKNTVNDLYKETENFGTVMGIDVELNLMKNLENLEINDIESNMDKFKKILDLLYESHADDCCYVDETNARQIKTFLEWLIKIGKETSVDDGFIESMLGMFSINVNKNLPKEEKISLPPYKYCKKGGIPADLDKLFDGIVHFVWWRN